MAETSRITLTDIWKQWEEMTSTLPKEAKEMADAYIRQKRADLPVSPDMHFEDLGPVDWLETMILDGNSGLDLLLNRMLYAAWRMGEGFLLGSGWSSICVPEDWIFRGRSDGRHRMDRSGAEQAHMLLCIWRGGKSALYSVSI